MPLEKVVFESHPVYASKPSPESDAAWNALLPVLTPSHTPLLFYAPSSSASATDTSQEGRGFIFVPDRTHYTLPPGQSTPWGDIYSISLFHQLHCLAQIRKHYWMLLTEITSSDAAVFEGVRQKAARLMGDEGEHMTHCIDYVRQGIMCAGDMAMEWPRTEPDGITRVSVDGWGVPHTCHSWVSRG